MAKKTQKEKALDIIIDAMNEITVNLNRTEAPENVKANADAMLKLSEAYANIEKANPSEVLAQLNDTCGAHRLTEVSYDT